MEPGGNSWRPPYRSGIEEPKVKYLQDSPFFKVSFSLTFIVAFLFFLASIFVLFTPSNPSDFAQPSSVYFFILILNTPFISFDTFWVVLIVVILYSIFFSTMLYTGFSKMKGSLMDNPVFYYGGMVSFGYLMSLVITVIEMALGVQIGGTSIETGLQQHPYLMYVQLIYAPFAEELGFRIIPLGLLSVYLVRRARTLGTTGIDAVLSFILPGIIRKKYGISLTKWDYILIVATSVLFGFAHYLFGAWDPGKIVSAALVGLILAFGFIKFGIFVDIPMHWFFNGISTLYVVNPAFEYPFVVALLWFLISGVVAVIFLLAIFSERKKKGGQASSPPSYPLS